MAVTSGGSKANLVVGSPYPDTSEQNYGKKRYLAQTFTLTETTVVFRCLFKSWAIYFEAFYHYGLRYTNPDGSPWASDIDHTTLSPLGTISYEPGKWRRFDFMAFPEVPPGVYALVASIPDAPFDTASKLRCSEYPNVYQNGKAWISDDEGFTWERVYNLSFVFSVYGWTPPPAPPPPVVVSNWAVLDIEQKQMLDGFTIIVTTNIPCHLFMRWTNVKPQQHKIPRERRGIFLYDDKRFCFVAYHENEQEELGDTLIHTFVKEDWPICETRYFYFVGTRNAEQQPSTSSIFTKHFPREGWSLLFREIWSPPPSPPPPPEFVLYFTEIWSS